ncbi:MAG: leucyl aminopeptidase family protein [Weeksellaceae bacterium]|nr:leucyl aminopeptidase family protein [Weeksellaceae bacterium]
MQIVSQPQSDIQTIHFFTKESLKQAQLSLLSNIAFEAGKKEFAHALSQDKNYFLIGLGEETTQKALRDIAASFAHTYRKKIAEEDTQIILPESLDEHQQENLLIGLFSGLYTLDKKEAKSFLQWDHSIKIVTQHAQAEEFVQKAKSITEGKFIAMDLLNLPPNHKNSEILKDFFKNMASEYGWEFNSMGREECKKQNLHSFLAVNQASAHKPAFVTLQYKPENAVKKVVLIGKCITFDTGGVSIKPSENMHLMKSDMGGATTVLGTLIAATQLQLPVHIYAVFPATDNVLSATAYLPGDVIASHAGKTIEVINTDAEGRMTLADALSYSIKEYQADIVLDIATLTGSVVRALGYQAAGIFSSNDKLLEQIQNIGNETGERVWPFPMWDEYAEDLKSDVADLKHISNTPLSDVIYAAKFLQAFTHDHKSWVHIDIAGVAFGSNAYSKDRSATGYGVQLLTNWLQSIKAED